MLNIQNLKLEAKGFSVLYVEDNVILRENASKLLKKIFNTVYTASDGKKGLSLFKKYSPQIVITDIKMPNMNGMELTKHIKDISPDTKVLLMSAFDNSEYLYSAIELGIFRFLKKPVNIKNFSKVLHSCVKEIKKEQNIQLFNTHLKSIFNYQSSIVVMMKDSKSIFVNQMFLDYFKVESIEEFIEKHGDLGNLFLEHDGFLYNKADKNWFDELSVNPQKLYNIKLQDKDENFKHFIVKYQIIPDKDSYGILSFDDITELNLLKLYDASRVKSDENIKDSKAMFKLLEIIHRNSAKIQLQNYYKGLSIVNNAIITEMKEDSLVIKTNFLQQKAVQHEKKSIIVSDALPNAIVCDEVVNMSFDNQSIVFKNIHFISTSPVTRSTVRVVPEDKHTVSLFLGDNKFQGEVSIEDISLDAIKLKLNALPAGLVKDDEVHIDIVLTMDNKPLIINSKATMFRKKENRHSFSVVFIFDGTKKSELVKYITKRQMAIIREFKGLQNG